MSPLIRYRAEAAKACVLLQTVLTATLMNCRLTGSLEIKHPFNRLNCPAGR
ncbi:MAG: hypothetical protein ABII12_09765 [Planctomycetota bacterium]